MTKDQEAKYNVLRTRRNSINEKLRECKMFSKIWGKQEERTPFTEMKNVCKVTFIDLGEDGNHRRVEREYSIEFSDNELYEIIENRTKKFEAELEQIQRLIEEI